jgi:hypothetical protein
MMQILVTEISGLSDFEVLDDGPRPIADHVPREEVLSPAKTGSG